MENRFVTNCKEKATLFNNYFVSQCTPLDNESTLPPFFHHTNNRLSCFEVTTDEITEILYGINVNKSHGPDEI